MAIEQDAARDGKKTIAIIGAAAVCVLGGAYLGWGYLSRSEEPESQYNLKRVASSTPVTSQESQQYRQLLSQANRMGARQAEQEGDSFLAALSTGNPEPETPPPPQQDVQLQTTPPAGTGNEQHTGGTSDGKRQQIQAFLAKLDQRWAPGEMTLAATFDGNAQGNSGEHFSQWAAGVPGLQTVSQTTAPQRTAGKPDSTPVTASFSIPGLSRYPGTMETSVDSDNAGSVVLASIPAGKLRGAVLSARGVQLAGDGVVIHFTTMQYAGQTCTIDAYALDDETQRSSVASDINHRYFSRIILPALANGIGKVGQLYEDSNTQILTTNSGTVTGRTGTPDGKAVAGVIAGGIGQQTAQVMTQDAARLPPTQAVVDRKQVVSILFMKPVSDKDCLPSSTGNS